MNSIFIGSTGNEPGQTLAAWALASRLKEKGLKVGFFKPYGLLPNREPAAGEFLYDPDVLLLKQVLGLTEEGETLCPVMLTDNIISEVTGSKGEELLRRIDEAFQEAIESSDHSKLNRIIEYMKMHPDRAIAIASLLVTILGVLGGLV